MPERNETDAARSQPPRAPPVPDVEAIGLGDAFDSHWRFWALTLVGLLGFLYVFRDILLPFVSGAALAYALNPLADRLERAGVGRTTAAALIVALLACLAVGALVVLVPLLVTQTQDLARALPGEIDRLRGVVEPWAEARLGTHFPALKAAFEKGIGEVSRSVAGLFGSLLTGLVSQGLALINVVSVVLITPLVLFYLLSDWHKLLAWLRALLPRDYATVVGRLATDIDHRTAAFVRGQGLVCLVLGVFYAIGLTAFGIDYGAIVGIGTGLLGFVPVVGWLLGLAVAMMLALLKFGFALGPLASVAGVMAAGMVLDTAVLSPRLVGSRLGLHPVWLIFALYAFSAIFGLVGTLVAVPLAAAVGVLVRHGLTLYTSSRIYRGAMS